MPATQISLYCAQHNGWEISLYYRGAPGRGEFFAIARGAVEWHSAGFKRAEHATSHARRLADRYDRCKSLCRKGV